MTSVSSVVFRLLGLTLALALVLALNNGHYLFATELYENGDHACNSFAILRARNFEQLTGNSSRWGWHHPGPAWFYCYAAGEALFHDTLGLVPTPFNAQVLTVTLLASFFLAASLTILHREVGARCFLPLSLIVCALYLAPRGGSCMQDPWPPFVLLLPFLLLLVASASVAKGATADLPLLALAVGFLIHGHVAQALFVVPLAGLAVVRVRRPGRWPLGLTLLIGALFLLPLLVDASRGSQSNLSQLVGHLGKHHDRKPLLRSLAYLQHFAVPDELRADGFLETPGTLFEILDYGLEHSAQMLCWGALWLLFGIACLRTDWPFLRWFGLVVGMAAGLSVVWGCLQNGPMFYFNAWYVLALNLAVALGVTAVASRRVPPGAAPFFLGAALVSFGVVRADYRFEAYADSREFGRAILAALEQNRSPQPIYLAFDVRDGASCAELSRVALLLARRGQPLGVAPWFNLAYGPENSLELTDPRVQGGQVPIWRIAPKAGLVQKEQPVVSVGELTGMVLRPSAAAPVTFADGGNCLLYVAGGWGRPAPWGRMTVTRTELIEFRPEPARGPVTLSMEVFPDPEHPQQRAKISINGREMGICDLRQQTVVRFDVPAELWNLKPSLRLVFEFLDVPDEVASRRPGLLAPFSMGWGFSRLYSSSSSSYSGSRGSSSSSGGKRGATPSSSR